MDFCYHAGRSYLMWVDCYSDWPIIAPMDKATTAHLIVVCIEIFGQAAVPDVLWTNGGPQFTSRVLQDLLYWWGILHKKSMLYYPQSIGKAEATVKAMKKILRAAWTGRVLDRSVLCQALIQYHNTPSAGDGLSPAQKLYGHPIQGTLPIHQSGNTAGRKQNDTLSNHRSSTEPRSRSLSVSFSTSQ